MCYIALWYTREASNTMTFVIACLWQIEPTAQEEALASVDEYSQVRILALKSGEASYRQDEIHAPTRHWSQLSAGNATAHTQEFDPLWRVQLP